MEIDQNRRFAVGILNGGKSSRMGSDKSLLSYRGVTLAEYIYREATMVSQDVFFLGGSPLPDSLREVSVVEDRYFPGPLGGLAGACEFSPLPLFLWAVDMPLLDHQDLLFLLEYSEALTVPVIPYDEKEEIYEVLFAFYPADFIEKIVDSARKKHYKSIQKTMKEFAVKGNSEIYRKLSGRLKSWNTPADRMI